MVGVGSGRGAFRGKGGNYAFEKIGEGERRIFQSSGECPFELVEMGLTDLGGRGGGLFGLAASGGGDDGSGGGFGATGVFEGLTGNGGTGFDGSCSFSGF